MKDLIIVGAGPAGITASIYAARKKLEFLVITQNIGGQAAWSGNIENYTGFHLIPGPELISKFIDHMKNYEIPINERENVKAVEKNGSDFIVVSDKGEYQAKTIIIASGKKSRLLNVPGEIKFNRKGVHYCAICDGPVFTNKEVAVIGGGNSGLDAALAMTKIAKKILLLTDSPKLTGDPIMAEKVETASNVTILYNAFVREIYGDKFARGIKIEQEGKIKDLSVEGIFVEIGLIPNSDFISIVKKNDKNEIIIDCAARTSHSGIFAAGDVTTIPGKQIVIAAGDGAKAALSAFDYLNHLTSTQTR